MTNVDTELLGKTLQRMGVKRSRQRARIAVSFEVLKEALDLPEGTEIVGASSDLGCMATGALFLSVEHPDLKWMADGDRSPLLVPSFSQNQDTAIEFEGWNQE